MFFGKEDLWFILFSQILVQAQEKSIWGLRSAEDTLISVTMACKLDSPAWFWKPPKRGANSAILWLCYSITISCRLYTVTVSVIVSIHYLNTTKGNKWMQMWRAVYPSFHQAFFTVPAGLPFWYYSHLDQGRVQKVKKQVYSAWIQPFQDKQMAWIQPFQDFYIFGSLKSWNGWIQAKNPFFPFFAYFEASSHSNYCTDKFVVKNCTNGWKMKKIKEHVFWVFLKKTKNAM